MTQLCDYLRKPRGKRPLREAAELTHGVLSHNTIAHAERGTHTRARSYKELARTYNVDQYTLIQIAGYSEKVPGQGQPELQITDITVPVCGEIKPAKFRDPWQVYICGLAHPIICRRLD